VSGKKNLSDKLEAAKKKAAICEFEVTITETSKMTVTVEAKSREEAEKIVSDNWHEDEYLIDPAEHFAGVKFEAVPVKPERSRGAEERK
jgi:hypothetical protein